ncbi:hypothetical protein BOO30_19400 [Vibrio navarrensis]|nr:hypothetical protein [Vibrio navarrensis]MBE4598513.1 hypothetical protein [Vibrio navarrensis]
MVKDLKFCPNIDRVEDIDFRPSMIESAYDYFMICTTSPHQRMGIQTVLCALTIEIILKSFHATVSANEGKINEKYAFNKRGASLKKFDAHDLINLYESLPYSLKNTCSTIVI